MGGCIPQGDLLSEFQLGGGAKVHYFPLNLPVCPPFPSVCQLPVYCPSSPNPFFFALLCDVGSGLHKHFSLASWLNVRLCQQRDSVKGTLQGHRGRRGFLSYFRCADFQWGMSFSGLCPVTLSIPHRPPGRLYCGLTPTLSHPPTNVSTARWATFIDLCGLLAVAGVLAASRLCVPAEHDLSAGSEPSLWSGGEVLLSSLVPSLFAFPQP